MTRPTNQSPTPGGRVEAAELTDSDRHRLFAAERRRLALDILVDRSPPVGLAALAEALAVRERAAGRNPVADDVAIDLYHRHLPLMADLSVVDFDPETRRVEAVPHAGTLV